MAAPSCFITTIGRNLENELPADTEQNPPLALSLGLDHSEFIAAIAPKPVILIGQEKDAHDVRGLEESYKRLRSLYRLLGAEQNIELFIGPGVHGFSLTGREAIPGEEFRTVCHPYRGQLFRVRVPTQPGATSFSPSAVFRPGHPVYFPSVGRCRTADRRLDQESASGRLPDAVLRMRRSGDRRIQSAFIRQARPMVRWWR